MTDRGPTQDSVSRINGLKLALEMSLRVIAEQSGNDARAKLEAIRDQAIRMFKNAGIPAERELEHAAIAGPAIEVIQLVFDGVINELP